MASGAPGAEVCGRRLFRSPVASYPQRHRVDLVAGVGLRLDAPAAVGGPGQDAVIAGSEASVGGELLPGEVPAAARFEIRALPGVPDADVDRGDRYRAPRPAADRDGPR